MKLKAFKVWSLKDKQILEEKRIQIYTDLIRTGWPNLIRPEKEDRPIIYITFVKPVKPQIPRDCEWALRLSFNS